MRARPVWSPATGAAMRGSRRSSDAGINAGIKKPAPNAEGGLIEFFAESELFGNCTNLNESEVLTELIGFGFCLSLAVNSVKDDPLAWEESELSRELGVISRDGCMSQDYVCRVHIYPF